MKNFKITEELRKIVTAFSEKNFVANDGTLVLAMGCNPCSGSCGGNCSGSCAGSCRGNCTYSCQRYSR